MLGRIDDLRREVVTTIDEIETLSEELVAAEANGHDERTARLQNLLTHVGTQWRTLQTILAEAATVREAERAAAARTNDLQEQRRRLYVWQAARLRKLARIRRLELQLAEAKNEPLPLAWDDAEAIAVNLDSAQVSFEQPPGDLQTIEDLDRYADHFEELAAHALPIS